MAFASGIAAAAMPSAVRTVQVTSNVGSQLPTWGGGACHEKDVENVEVRASPDGHEPATVADTVAVAAPDLVGNDVMAIVEQMVEC